MDAPPGVHRLETVILHADLSGGRSFGAWDLTVPEVGDDVGLVPAEPL